MSWESSLDKWRSNSLRIQLINLPFSNRAPWCYKMCPYAPAFSRIIAYRSNSQINGEAESHKFPQDLRLKKNEIKSGGNKNVELRCKSRKTNKRKWIQRGRNWDSHPNITPKDVLRIRLRNSRDVSGFGWKTCFQLVGKLIKMKARIRSAGENTLLIIIKLPFNRENSIHDNTKISFIRSSASLPSTAFATNTHKKRKEFIMCHWHCSVADAFFRCRRKQDGTKAAE